MIRRTILTLSAVATFGLATLSLGQSARAAEPTIVGTWELNVAASKSTDPLPKGGTRTYEIIGNSEKMAGTIVTADGKTIPVGFTATLDGKDSPSQNPGVDTIVLTAVDAWTLNYTTKLAGKVVYSGSRVLSKDGKSFTLTSKGMNPAGKPVESTFVYDRR
jgi:hypothetical protein